MQWKDYTHDVRFSQDCPQQLPFAIIHVLFVPLADELSDLKNHLLKMEEPQDIRNLGS